MKNLILTTCVFLTACVAPSYAQNRNCGTRENIIERLVEKYGEELFGAGLTHTRGLLEVYVSPETGTWTILMSFPNGQSCLLQAGEYWEEGTSPTTKPEGTL